jgi:SAM-dependent methyltransferase
MRETVGASGTDTGAAPARTDRSWTGLQYRLLKRIAPSEPGHMSGSAYANRSKLQVLLGPELIEEARGKDVLDFGCGVGTEAVELASTARSVFGLDILSAALAEARALAASAGVADRCVFGTEPPAQKVDIIVSLDSFEHFGDPSGVLAVMHDLLRPGGRVLASFGPTWFHPYGGHLFSVFPWAHLLFSEAALIRWRSDIRSDGAVHFRDVEGGLNQMTIGRFERLVAASPLRVIRLETVPIRKLARMHNHVSREFTTAIVRCTLERPA